MPFDPISWAAGFVLTNAARKGLDTAFTSDLRTSLEKEIENWSAALPSFAHPATLFSVVDRSNREAALPAISQVRSKLLELVIPTREEWANAFIEQWRLVRAHLGTEAQPFFLLPEVEASPYLVDLAARVHGKCTQDQKFAMPHMVAQLDQIQVTLSELLQLQALRALPPNLDPDQTGMDRITRTVVHIGVQRGWPNAFAARIVKAGKTRIVIVFAESDQYQPVVGVVEIEEERLAIWSSLTGSALQSAISRALFELPLFTGVEDNWNSMVTFVGSVSETLYPDSIRNGVFGISARFDLKRIGVPFPASRSPRAGDERVVSMKLEKNEFSIPFLTFGLSELEQLVGASPAEAAGIVAQWLSNEWGRPSLIH